MPHGLLPWLQGIVHGNISVQRLRMHAAGNELMHQRQRAHHRFDRAGSAQGVTGKALAGTAHRITAKQGMHGHAFGHIVGGRGRAVQIDVVHLLRAQARHVQSALHGRARACALGVRSRHMVGIAGFAIAAQHDAVCGKRLRLLVRQALQQGKRRRLANRQAVALRIERTARRLGHEAQRAKAVQGGQAQAVHTTHYHGIDQPGLQHARGAGKHFGR